MEPSISRRAISEPNVWGGAEQSGRALVPHAHPTPSSRADVLTGTRLHAGGRADANLSTSLPLREEVRAEKDRGALGLCITIFFPLPVYLTTTYLCHAPRLPSSVEGR